MQILFASAPNATPPVAFPNLDLNRGRNHPIVVDCSFGNPCDFERLVDNLEFELEDLTTFRCFLPSVNQVKEPVVYLNASPNLLKHFHFLCVCPTSLKTPDRIGEWTILG